MLSEDKLVELYCQRNGWEYGDNADYDEAVRDVKWFRKQIIQNVIADLRDEVTDLKQLAEEAKQLGDIGVYNGRMAVAIKIEDIADAYEQLLKEG